MMKLIYSLFCFCLSLTPLLAYPVDYNETSAEITREALTDLINLISNNAFPTLLQQYNDNINEINSKAFGKMKTHVDTFSQRLTEIEDSATEVGADITGCLENLSELTPELIYQKYTEECVNPSRALGLNLITLGNNKQTVVSYKKYHELMSYFQGCLHTSDPAPHICAGVVESTLQEVQRVIPAVKANPLRIQRELEQQILVLTECAYEQVSLANNRMKVEFYNVEICILNKINTK